MGLQNLHSAVDLGEIAVGHHLGGLVADAELEASGAPVDELDRPLRLERGDSSVGVLGDNVAAVQQAGGHVLAGAGVALDHLVVGLEAGHGDLLNRVGLVGGLDGRDDRRVGDQGEVDTRIGHKVRLELVQIDVERAIEAERRGNRRDNCRGTLEAIDSNMGQLEPPVATQPGCPRIRLLTLRNKPVEVRVIGALETKAAAADIVDGLVVDHERAVGVLEGGVGGEDRVVGLNDGGGGLGSRIDAELELALLAVVEGQAFHEEGTETGTGTTTERVEDEEALETNTVVRDTANLVEDPVDKLLAHGVVTARVVVRGILLARDHLLGVEQVAVGAGADLIDDVGLEIAVDGTGDVLALA